MRSTTVFATVLAAVIAAGAGSARADNIAEELDVATKKYATEDIQGALESVRLVEAWLLEKLAEGLTGIFGDLEGWEKEVGEGQSAGAAFMGGGISASCRYSQNDLSIDANVLGQSPMLSMTMSMISNPMIASSSGGKIIKVGGHKAMVKQEKSSWQLMLPYENSVLIDIKTNGTKENAIAAAEAIDFELLKELTSAQ